MKVQEQSLINQSIVLPDEVKHVKEQLANTNQRLKKYIILCVIASAVLLGLALFFFIKQMVDSEAEDLRITNSELASQNQEIINSNTKMEKDIQGLVSNMMALNANISKFNNQINTTSQQIIDLQTYLKQNCDVFHQKLWLNDTNINAFVMAVPGSAHSQSPIPAITDLDLSMNKLTSFCDNVLPNLVTIDLSDNPIVNISNNRLNSLDNLQLHHIFTFQEFNGNILPILTKLDLRYNRLTSFKDNYFSQIQSIRLYENRLTEISNYSLNSLSYLQILDNPIKILRNNKFPALTELMGIDEVNLNIVTGNYFGRIKKFFTSCSSQILTFQANSMPYLENLTINRCSYDYDKMKTNDFQSISSLAIKDSWLNNFQYIPQISRIKEFSLNSTNITSFSSHNYQQLTKLILQDNTQLALFDNNSLLSLEYLFISGSEKLQSVCKSDMPRLKIFKVRGLKLADLACFKNFQSLEQIDISSHSIIDISNFNLPNLKNLVLISGDVQTFKNNSFPSLQQLQIQLNSSQIDLSSYQTTLSTLSLYGRLTIFSNYNFLSLKQLTLKLRDNIDFAANNFSKLTHLNLTSMSTSKLDQNYFGPLQRIDIAACLSQCTLSPKYDRNLRILAIQSSNFVSFINREIPDLVRLVITNSALQSFLINKLPSIKQIDLSNNNLASFDCYGISTVQVLNLSNNKLTDAIANTLLSCTFNSLNFLNLLSNPNIKNPAQVHSQLSAVLRATILI